MTLLCANPGWLAEEVHVEREFMQGDFKCGDIFHMEVRDGMAEYYSIGKRDGAVLL